MIQNRYQDVRPTVGERPKPTFMRELDYTADNDIKADNVLGIIYRFSVWAVKIMAEQSSKAVSPIKISKWR